MAPDSLITAWRRDYGFNRNVTMSAALPSTIMQPQLPYSNVLPMHDLPLTGTISLLHQPVLLVSLPEPALPVSLPEPVLPVSLPNHVLPVFLPEPALSVSSPQTVQLVSLPQPVEPVALPQPALPLEPDQVMLVHNSKPLTSSKHTIATQARRSGHPGRPSTRAEEANKISDTSSQQVTKAAPKRKQNTIQPHSSESRKKSRK
ncbi:hypothetical protein EV424DRAFT_1541335 [Suillus variegatus]|nr:hypothetical protein EV424DRAFT_1541335 [Suillus variegatus]